VSTRAGPAAAASTRTTPSTLQARRLWIVDPWHDLALIVGAPAIILPAIWLLEARFQPNQIYLFVASFGAVGHHLPGMMRAYGDRYLFDRFRYRFVLTPLVLGGTCLLFAVRDLNAMVLIAYLWGVWHGLMQTYGFARIYETKAGATSRIAARLDFGMCVAWFGAAVLLSPTRMAKMLNDYYRSGGAPVPSALLSGTTAVWLTATGVVTIAFLAYLAYRWVRGATPSAAKLLLMATSFAFWWYSNVSVSNMLVGIALFEIFHDVQYLTIVWVFNLNRVERQPGLGRFTRFLFRRSWGLAGLYVGLVAAYGSLNLLPPVLPHQTLTRALTGLLTASALLHFYYDGFIWKVRETSVSQTLGLSSFARGARERGASAGPIDSASPASWVHALKWAGFVLPVLWLGLAQGQSTMAALERQRLVVEAVPQSADARNNLGGAMLVGGNIDGAIVHLREAIRLDPAHAEAHSNLGVALARRGRWTEAIDHDREAIRLDTRQTQAYSNLGNALLQQGQVREAIATFEAGLSVDASDPQARTNLAGALLRDGRPDEAVAALEQVLRLTPTFEPARRNLDIIRRQRLAEER